MLGDGLVWNGRHRARPSIPVTRQRLSNTTASSPERTVVSPCCPPRALLLVLLRTRIQSCWPMSRMPHMNTQTRGKTTITNYKAPCLRHTKASRNADVPAPAFRAGGTMRNTAPSLSLRTIRRLTPRRGSREPGERRASDDRERVATSDRLAALSHAEAGQHAAVEEAPGRTQRARSSRPGMHRASSVAMAADSRLPPRRQAARLKSANRRLGLT